MKLLNEEIYTGDDINDKVNEFKELINCHNSWCTMYKMFRENEILDSYYREACTTNLSDTNDDTEMYIHNIKTAIKLMAVDLANIDVNKSNKDCVFELDKDNLENFYEEIYCSIIKHASKLFPEEELPFIFLKKLFTDDCPIVYLNGPIMSLKTTTALSYLAYQAIHDEDFDLLLLSQTDESTELLIDKLNSIILHSNVDADLIIKGMRRVSGVLYRCRPTINSIVNGYVKPNQYPKYVYIDDFEFIDNYDETKKLITKYHDALDTDELKNKDVKFIMTSTINDEFDIKSYNKDNLFFPNGFIHHLVLTPEELNYSNEMIKELSQLCNYNSEDIRREIYVKRLDEFFLKPNDNSEEITNDFI